MQTSFHQGFILHNSWLPRFLHLFFENFRINMYPQGKGQQLLRRFIFDFYVSTKLVWRNRNSLFGPDPYHPILFSGIVLWLTLKKKPSRIFLNQTLAFIVLLFFVHLPIAAHWWSSSTNIPTVRKRSSNLTIIYFSFFYCSIETITLGDKRIGIKTSVLEEKATACNMLCCYADELKEGFYPWIDQVSYTFA